MLADVHQNLIFDTAGCVGGKLDVLVCLEGVDRLDQPDCADGYQILDPRTRVFKSFGNVDHQPQIVFDKGLAGAFVLVQPVDDLSLLLP